MMRLRKALEGFYTFVEQPIYLWARPIVLLLLVPLLWGAMQPLWHIHLEAPQYPKGLDVDIYAYMLKGGNDGADLQEINILNHYIGMSKIDRAALTDLDWLPFGFGMLALLALRLAVLGNIRSLLDMTAILVYFTGFSMARFYLKMYAFGHDLNPDAPVKVPPFTPALLGSKEIGNFTTTAGPSVGTYMVAVFAVGIFVLTMIHLIRGRCAALREPASVKL